jgi:hypothetical protein
LHRFSSGAAVVLLIALVPARAAAQQGEQLSLARAATPATPATLATRYAASSAVLSLAGGPVATLDGTTGALTVTLRAGVEARLHLRSLAFQLQLDVSTLGHREGSVYGDVRLGVRAGVGYVVPLTDRLITTPILAYEAWLPVGAFSSVSVAHQLSVELNLGYLVRDRLFLECFLAPGVVVDPGVGGHLTEVSAAVAGGLRIGLRM